jgi:hypothetical protein
MAPVTVANVFETMILWLIVLLIVWLLLELRG